MAPSSASPKRGTAASSTFRPMSIVAKRLVDQHGTWHGGRPWFSPHCARWGNSSPPQKGVRAPQFLAHLYCGQTAGCITMPLGMEVGLSPSDFVLDGDPAPTPKGAEPHPIFGTCLLWPNGCMDQDATWYAGRPRPTGHCIRCGPSYPQKKGHTHPHPILAHVYCGQMVGWMMTPLGTKVDRPQCTRRVPSSRPVSIVATVAHLSYC